MQKYRKRALARFSCYITFRQASFAFPSGKDADCLRLAPKICMPIQAPRISLGNHKAPNFALFFSRLQNRVDQPRGIKFAHDVAFGNFEQPFVLCARRDGHGLMNRHDVTRMRTAGL